MANLPPEPGRLVLHIFIQIASKRRQQVSETPAVAGRYSAYVATSSWSMESAVSFPFWNGFACKLFVVGCYAGVGICFTDFHSRRRCSYVPFVPYALRTNCVDQVEMPPTLRNSQKRRKHADNTETCVCFASTQSIASNVIRHKSLREAVSIPFTQPDSTHRYIYLKYSNLVVNYLWRSVVEWTAPVQ